MKFHPMTLDPRSAGRVTRYHTEQHITKQSVGEHTWQVIRILLAIWPDCPRYMIVEIMFHDVGERGTGDIPFPVKAKNPMLKSAMDAMEDEVIWEMSELGWGVISGHGMGTDQRAIFKMAEFIDMWEHALDEISMGNKNAELVRQRCWDGIVENLSKINPDEVRLAVHMYIDRRMKYEQYYRGGKIYS